jgi:hypothetical protein
LYDVGIVVVFFLLFGGRCDFVSEMLVCRRLRPWEGLASTIHDWACSADAPEDHRHRLESTRRCHDVGELQCDRLETSAEF